jgi:hypothetical protein
MRIVVISWPADPDRGTEHYGPFGDDAAQMQFAAECQEAASLGWHLLDGASYLLTQVGEPFDPTALMTDAMHVPGGGCNHGAPAQCPEHGWRCPQFTDYARHGQLPRLPDSVLALPVSHAAKCLDWPRGCGEYARQVGDRTAVLRHRDWCPADTGLPAR